MRREPGRPDRPTLVLVAPYFAPRVGGLEHYAHGLATAMALEHGWRVVVVTTNHLGRGYRVEEMDGLTVHRLPVWFTVSNTPVNPLWPVRVWLLLRRERPAVVNAHTPVPGLADVAVWAAGRTPTVVTYHAATLEKDQSRTLALLVRGYTAVQRRTLRRASAVIAVSEHVRACLDAEVRPKTSVVTNAIAGTEIRAERPAHRPDQLLFLGSLDRSHAWKGLDLILQAVAGYRDRYGERLELVVAGDGNGRTGYRRRAAELGVADRVRFAGMVTGPAKEELLASATALVSYPVTANDAFPTVFLEAWAHRLPVVAAALGAIPSVLEDEVTGLLVPPHRPDLLAGTIRRLLTDPGLQARLAAAGAERVASHHTWTRQAAITDRLLTELAGAARAGPIRERVHARATGWWRRRVLARSIEVPVLPRRRLTVLAAHPDDETLGCGALIARTRRAGLPVRVVVATDGRHSTASELLSPERLAMLRSVELRAACLQLGVPDPEIVELGFVDGTLAAQGDALLEQLTQLLAAEPPDVLLVPCARDVHPDHEELFRAAVRAAARLDPAPTVLAYPIWSWAAPGSGTGLRDRLARLGWSARQLGGTRWLRVPAGEHLAGKRAALDRYATQNRNLTGEAGWSSLPPQVRALFLQPDELFLPVGLGRGGR
jgi:glycosyltransferase involved in cell wall biosynthesis/LmbE family N-acetylglucosaminyl deacetylase